MCCGKCRVNHRAQNVVALALAPERLQAQPAASLALAS